VQAIDGVADEDAATLEVPSASSSAFVIIIDHHYCQHCQHCRDCQGIAILIMVSPSQPQVPVGIPIVYRFAQVDGKLTPQAPGDVLLQPLLQGGAISRATSSLPPQAPDAVAECLADFAPGRPPCVSADFLAGEAALAKAFLESRRASLDRYGLGGDPSIVEITRDHPRSPEITRDHPRSPEITRDHPRSPEMTRSSRASQPHG